MSEKEGIGIDIEIDELTNSIKNVVTGDTFATDVMRINKNDINNITKNNE